VVAADYAGKYHPRYPEDCELVERTVVHPVEGQPVPVHDGALGSEMIPG
jgi:hypothetical protein